MKKILFLLSCLLAINITPSTSAGPKLETCKRVLAKISSIAVPAAAEIGLGVTTGLIRTTVFSSAIQELSDSMFPNVRPYRNGQQITPENIAIDNKKGISYTTFYALNFFCSEALRYKIARALKDKKEAPSIAPAKEGDCADKQSKTKFERIRSFIPSPSLSFITSMVIEALSIAKYIPE